MLAVQTNPTFIDALLIGANHQTLGELRWRNLPITTRWTPLRRFWERIDVGAGEVATDIRPVVALATDQPIWTDASTLGDVTHLSDPTNGANLVVVLHTELFRRYPATIVYLHAERRRRRRLGAGARRRRPRRRRTREYPTFSGTLTPELVFFGFDVPPSAGDATTGSCSRSRRPATASARTSRPTPTGQRRPFAEATFAGRRPRVFFGNLL